VGSCRHTYCLQQVVCTGGWQLQTQVLYSPDCLYSQWAVADTSTSSPGCLYSWWEASDTSTSSPGCLYSWWAAADTSTLFSRLSVQLVGSCRHKYFFTRLSVQLVGSCRHKYCLQQAVCTAGGQLQTQVLSSPGCLYSRWVAADTRPVCRRLSVQLVGSCRHKYFFIRLSVQLVCSCRHNYCLHQAVCTVGGKMQTQVLLHQAVCTAGGQLQTQVLSSAGCLYSWWAAAETSTVFTKLSVQSVGSCRHKYSFTRLFVQLVGSCRHKYCLQQALCTVGVQLQTQVLSSAGCLYSWWEAGLCG